MKKSKTENPSASSKKIRPALTPEARENQLISLAVDLAEKQLIEGTASSQVITHYLKLGSTRERLEWEKLKEENNLLRAKVKAIDSADEASTRYKNAIDAFRIYSGHGDEEECDDEYDY